MGISSSAGTQPEAPRRTIRFTFISTVAIPATCLILLWALAAGAVLGSSLGGHGLWSPDHREVVELTILVGAGLLVGLVCVILMGRFSYKLSRDIAVLASTVQRSADEQLPQLLERLRSGQTPAGAPEAPLSRPRPKNAEIARALAAVGSLEQTAVGAAAGEAGLRDGLRQVFVSLARRNQSLLQRQLRLIDALEQKAPDSAALADLFALDHLTTRMRRHAESLAILSGAAPGRSWTEPVPIIDVIRAAMAEVEDYRRVTVLTTSEDAVAAPAVADMIHLLAELIENATMFSPSGTRVEVRAERVANGFAVEIDDRGLGIESAQLAEINQQLAEPPDFDLANADRLGLFVGAKLAARHGVRVSLRQSPYGGTTAIVLMPNSIVVLVSASAPPGTTTLPAARRATGRPAALDLGSGAALALTGRRGPEPSLAAIDQPGTVPQPGNTTQPGNSTQPGNTGQPASTAQPGTSAQPATTAPPTGTAQPANGSRPASAQPAGNGTAPVTRQPSTGQPVTGQPAGGPPGTVPRRGLPHRTRQASLSPHLRDNLAVGRPAASPAAPPDNRSPEQARDLAASLQTGWRRGRQDDAPEAPEPAAPPLPRRTGSPVPDSEEA
ncbi:MAG TPA: ATP-binding protein [Streptosporangiaceae bacterium]|nr:ATP-binding protein [Streptosporangiaceae bacterium]